MRITVFGGSGFLGSYVVQRLTALGHQVRVAVRHPDQAKFLQPLGNVGQIIPLVCDIRNPRMTQAALTGVDAAINLVGILYERGGQTFPAIHDYAVHTIIDAARAAKVQRLIHISAIGADPQAPSRYSRTKGLGEQHVRDSDLDWTILRPSVIFGAEDQFCNMFAQLAVISPIIPVIGGGRTKLQPVYVGDVAEAITNVLGDPKTIGKIYQLGGPQVYSFREILEKILAWTKRSPRLVSVPFPIATLIGYMNVFLPKPFLTADQVTLMRQDNVVSPGALGWSELGITPKTMATIVPAYLKRYRRQGI